MTDDPRDTALLDQAEAARKDARAFLLELAAQGGRSAVDRKLGPVTAPLLDAMCERGAAGGITLCPHLSYDHPAPAHWCPWAPGRLRCPDCLTAAMLRISGTAEDRRCDACGAYVAQPEMIYAAQVLVPPVPAAVKGRDSGTLWPLPPVTLHAGLCPACKEADGTW